MTGKKEAINATGVLYPIFESRGGAVTGVMLATNDEREYVVVGDRFMSELINLCQEEVRIRGLRYKVKGQWHLEAGEYELSVREDFDLPEPCRFHDDEDCRFDDCSQ